MDLFFRGSVEHLIKSGGGKGSLLGAWHFWNWVRTLIFLTEIKYVVKNIGSQQFLLKPRSNKRVFRRGRANPTLQKKQKKQKKKKTNILFLDRLHGFYFVFLQRFQNLMPELKF